MRSLPPAHPADEEAAKITTPLAPRRPRRWPLRRQLVIILVVVLAGMTAVIGAISITVQRQSLIERLDGQLSISLALTSRSRGAQPGVPSGQPPGDFRGPPLGSLELILSGGDLVTGELVDSSGESHELSVSERQVLIASAATGDGPNEVDLGAYGRYRVLGLSVTGDPETDLVLVGQSLAEVDQTTSNLTLIFALTGLLGVGIAALIAGALVRIGLRPLERLSATAARVGASPLASGEVILTDRVAAEDAVPGTETGELGAAFNQMLDNVEHSLTVRQASEERLRRFVADASHELRTPLASVMGYAELASRRADELPADVHRSLERIRSESARMAAMVQDLLLLARLDSGDGLGLERVELARVVMDACSDARVTGPDHDWQLELGEDAADLAVLGDSGRLHQVLMNLLSNARAHTPPGTRVLVRLQSVAGSSALIQVEDNGPGIDPNLQGQVFDRFVRGDDARSSALGSTGLGMAIVAAIVGAHHGLVDVESEPGRTVVTVSLPLA